MCRLGCRLHVTHGVLATYDKDTFHMSVIKLIFEIQENMLIPNESF